MNNDDSDWLIFSSGLCRAPVERTEEEKIEEEIVKCEEEIQKKEKK